MSEYLFSQFEFVQHVPIALGIYCFQIVQKFSSSSDKFKQTAARMVVFRVDLKVFCYFIDPCSEKGDLNV